MFTKRILFSALTSKTNGICEGTSKQSPDLKNYTLPGLHRDRAPRFLNSWIRHCKLFMTGELQTCSYFKILQTMSKLYITFIRPVLEYYSVVSDGCSLYDEDKLEKKGLPILASREALYLETGWKPLKTRSYAACMQK